MFKKIIRNLMYNNVAIVIVVIILSIIGCGVMGIVVGLVEQL